MIYRGGIFYRLQSIRMRMHVVRSLISLDLRLFFALKRAAHNRSV